jgi:hypothetical protein
VFNETHGAEQNVEQATLCEGKVERKIMCNCLFRPRISQKWPSENWPDVPGGGSTEELG